MSDPIVTAHLTREEIEERLTPDVYLGAAHLFVERALARWAP
jgi:adenylosuccinate lyase